MDTDAIIKEDGGTVYVRQGTGRRRTILVALWRVMQDFLKAIPGDDVQLRRVKFEIVLEWRTGEGGPDRVVVAESDFTIQKVRPTTVVIDGTK